MRALRPSPPGFSPRAAVSKAAGSRARGQEAESCHQRSIGGSLWRLAGSHCLADSSQNRGGCSSCLLISREKLFSPPPLPHVWPEAILRGRGGGVVHILKPPAAGFLYPPPSFMRPPPLKGYFQRWGGWGCIKFGPPLLRCCAA